MSHYVCGSYCLWNVEGEEEGGGVALFLMEIGSIFFWPCFYLFIFFYYSLAKIAISHYLNQAFKKGVDINFKLQLK